MKCLPNLYREPWCRFKLSVKPGAREMTLEETSLQMGRKRAA
jgi:hypothetical protein